MGKTPREFKTKDGKNVSLVGPYRSVQVWIDGKLRATVSGLNFARKYAAEYSVRHN